MFTIYSMYELLIFILGIFLHDDHSFCSAHHYYCQSHHSFIQVITLSFILLLSTIIQVGLLYRGQLCILRWSKIILLSESCSCCWKHSNFTPPSSHLRKNRSNFLPLPSPPPPLPLLWLCLWEKPEAFNHESSKILGGRGRDWEILSKNPLMRRGSWHGDCEGFANPSPLSASPPPPPPSPPALLLYRLIMPPRVSRYEELIIEPRAI